MPGGIPLKKGLLGLCLSKAPSERADSPYQGEMSRSDSGGRDAVAEGDWGRIQVTTPSHPLLPPRTGAGAGPYTGPSHMAEFPDLLHVCIHIMENLPLYVQKRGIFIFSEKILLRVQ